MHNQQGQLLELIDNYTRLYSFDYNSLDGGGYVLAVKEETTLNYLERKP